MPVGVPPGQRVEIEFVAGTWTDVTADVELLSQGPLTTHFGRTSPFAQPGPATMTVTLDNDRRGKGKYTPGRQVLTDGSTVHPYWPNVLPRKRIRWSYTIAGVTYYRFTGYIKGWPPALEMGVRPVVTLAATTRDDQLSRVTMQPPLATEYALDGPAVFWPLTDGQVSAGPQMALDASGNAQAPFVVGALGQPPVNFGDNGPGYGDGSGVKFAPASATAGQYLVAPKVKGLSLAAFTVEVWVNAGTALPAWVTGTATEMVLRFLRLSDLGFNGAIGIGANGRPFFQSSSKITGTASIVDGGWHHIAVTRSTSGGSCTLYVDGVNRGATIGSPAVTDMDYFTLGVGAGSTARFQGNVGYLAVYDHVLTPTRISAHYAAGNGYYGDTSDARMQRFLGTAGLTGTDWSLQAGQTTVNHYPQGGKDVVSACQDMATSEGGGAAFYVLPTGQMRFVNRRFRDNRTLALILDASIPALLDPGVYAPAFDETTLVNTSSVTRAAESGGLSTQAWTDPDSVGTYGPASPGDVTTYTTSDQDALYLAQLQVAGNAQPKFRLNQLAVNMHAAPVSLYAALAGVEIGSRIRIINLPPGAAPTRSLDLFVEGWSETVDNSTYRVVFDTSPADTPPRWKWDTSRWGPDRNGAVLNAGISNSATTLAIATLSGPTWTTNAGMYPLTIKVGEEQITLNTAPGGSTSPQTYTGVTRGVNGTTAAAQLANAVIDLAPADAWAL